MKGLVISAVLVAAFVTLATMDNTDAEKEHHKKCEMVKWGAWPESVLQGVECE